MCFKVRYSIQILQCLKCIHPFIILLLWPMSKLTNGILSHKRKYQSGPYGVICNFFADLPKLDKLTRKYFSLDKTEMHFR